MPCFMQARKPLLEAAFHALNAAGQRITPPRIRNGGPDRARQQQSPDPADDQKDAELFGYDLDR